MIYIVLVSTELDNAKAVAENFNGQIFEDVSNFDIYLEDLKVDSSKISMVSLNGFVKTCNEQNINLELYFLAKISFLSEM